MILKRLANEKRRLKLSLYGFIKSVSFDSRSFLKNLRSFVKNGKCDSKGKEKGKK